MGGVSHLYRLTLNSDNTVKVDIDQEEVYSGNMKDDWELLKPKIIPDPEDKKPGDWVDTSMMDDPEDAKPADWVEEKRIVDAEAKKPDDWDDEEDGEWEAPMKDNSEYKGVWKAKKIDNPEYVDDDSVYKYDAFGFIGFDLWQVKAETIFDNIIITDDAAEADAFAAKWKSANELESGKQKEEEEAKKAEEEAKKAADKSDDDDDDDDKDDDDKDEDM